MPARFTTTSNAFEKGIENTKPNAAVKLIEYWEEQLSSTEVSGTKGIAHDLEALKKALSSEAPDEAKVRSLLTKLGEATTRIAARAEDGSQGKLEELGKALTA